MALWTFVAHNMPLGRPGSLATEQYWNIVSYLLRQNGVEPDGQPLSEETAEQIRLGQPVVE